MGGWQSIFVTSFVLKTAIVRTGGTKTYEEWIVPIITGFLVGYTLISVVGGIVGAYRFFVPF